MNDKAKSYKTLVMSNGIERWVTNTPYAELMSIINVLKKSSDTKECDELLEEVYAASEETHGRALTGILRVMKATGE